MTYRWLRARPVLALTLGVPLTLAMTAATAAAAPQGDGAHGGPRYAPYFETWTKDKLARWPAPPARAP
jgi:hypothetical protein